MSDLDRRVLLGAAGVAGMAALAKLAGNAQAGPINPPAGPVGPSGRTLDEIYAKIPGANGTGDGRIAIPGGTSVVTISQPGSYVLTGNITVPLIRGIGIAASDVTLDLNGFTVSSAQFGPGASLSISSSLTDVVVRNGTFKGNTNGVDISSGVNRLVLEDLRFTGTDMVGLRMIGNSSRNITIRRCCFEDLGVGSSPIGLRLSGTDIRVEQCTISRFNVNQAEGIRVENATGVVLSGNTILSDNANGVIGIRISTTSLAVYRNNTVVGFPAAFSVGTAVDGGGNVSA